jgi:hypothetical protein
LAILIFAARADRGARARVCTGAHGAASLQHLHAPPRRAAVDGGGRPLLGVGRPRVLRAARAAAGRAAAFGPQQQ